MSISGRGRLAPRSKTASLPSVPDTGTLRGDLLALLTQANTMRNPMAALMSSMLGSYYNQTGPTPAELREAFLSQRGSVVEQVVNRAVERGEIDQARLTPRIIELPFDLFRNEMMMTLKPVPDHVLRQIVDDIFIPLVTTQRPAPAAGAGTMTVPDNGTLLYYCRADSPGMPAVWPVPVPSGPLEEISAPVNHLAPLGVGHPSVNRVHLRPLRPILVPTSHWSEVAAVHGFIEKL